VGRQGASAGIDEVALKGFRRIRARGNIWIREYHIGDDDRAGDGVAPRTDQGHANAGIGVQHRFDFFRIYLEAADVDDAAHSRRR